MDAINPTLNRVHETLFADLGKLGQLIEPCNDRALAVTYQALNHLRDLESLAEPEQPEVNGDKGLIGILPEDTLAHVSDVLAVLENLDYDECGSEQFASGMLAILSCAQEALEHEVGRIGTLRIAAAKKADV